jgi:hypothetical protein
LRFFDGVFNTGKHLFKLHQKFGNSKIEYGRKGQKVRGIANPPLLYARKKAQECKSSAALSEKKDAGLKTLCCLAS